MERITLTDEIYESYFPERYLAYKKLKAEQKAKDNRRRIDEIHENRRFKENDPLGD